MADSRPTVYSKRIAEEILAALERKGRGTNSLNLNGTCEGFIKGRRSSGRFLKVKVPL